jgi:glutamate--cysteine ligase
VGRGIEKESLRVTRQGALSARPHPAGLGSPLTHPNITTDFSEAQLELITAVHRSPAAVIAQLRNVHQFVYQNLDDELLWTASMPCLLGADNDIPVGRYGTSNIAKAKTVYRLGLGNRYGRLMQTISGIHYNFSLPESFWPLYAAHQGRANDQELRNAAYFGLIRNFRRYSWLLIYLFGASPAICKSFAKNHAHSLQPFDEGSLYLPHATSLRMGRLGYQSDAQSELHISYNSIDHYVRSMRDALTAPYPEYEAIGVKVDGNYRQLNAALLQIENEFYGTIRPKPLIESGERPLAALQARGVEYVEVRCLDLNPFLPVGIDEAQVRFIDMFLLYCLMVPSPDDSKAESARMTSNQLTVVERGREAGATLNNGAGDVNLQAWGRAILAACQPLATLLDADADDAGYLSAWQDQLSKLDDPQLTPSARILQTMSDQQIPFFRFAMNQSLAHAEYFARRPLSAAELASERALAARSLERQTSIEAADSVDFDTFLETYLALS